MCKEGATSKTCYHIQWITKLANKKSILLSLQLDEKMELLFLATHNLSPIEYHRKGLQQKNNGSVPL